MKITEKHLKKFHDRLEKIWEDIQDLADSCSSAEGETPLAEDLWTAHCEIESAMQNIDV